MNISISVLLAMALITPVQAAKIAMDDQSQLLASPQSAADETYFQSPRESELPNNAFGELVREGRAIFVDTQKNAPQHVGNGMNCTNCHLEQGRQANSAPLWGAYPMYPAYRKKNDKVNTYAERLQGCFQFSMNAKNVPAADSHVINALSVYSYWLATGAPTAQALPGRGYPEVPAPSGGHDLAKGEQIYVAQCAVCHGADGQGQKSADEYVFPPLWGKYSFNWGAGMHRINTAAGFIKSSMPLGKGNSLSDEEAWHVAAFMNSHERPQDPRLVDGSIETTREKYHANDVDFYGQVIDGVLIGQGSQ